MFKSSIAILSAVFMCGFITQVQAMTPVKQPVTQTVPAALGKDIHVGVNGMVCDFCAQSLKKTFKKQAAVRDVDISLEDKLVTVHLKPGQTIDDATIKKTISDAGYAVTTIHRM